MEHKSVIVKADDIYLKRVTHLFRQHFVSAGSGRLSSIGATVAAAGGVCLAAVFAWRRRRCAAAAAAARFTGRTRRFAGCAVNRAAAVTWL